MHSIPFSIFLGLCSLPGIFMLFVTTISEHTSLDGFSEELQIQHRVFLSKSSLCNAL